MSAGASSYDCQRCGACCVNLSDNQREGFHSYVEVERGDALLADAQLVKRFVVLDAAGVPHLRLDPSGRCAALKGPLGRRVRCTIYHDRPSPCRRVQAGSELCLTYRRDKGLPV